MSDAESGSHDDKLQELGQRYLLRTAEEVRGLLQALETAEADAQAFNAELIRTVHRIRGSGAMLGFQHITAATGELEEFANKRAAAELSESEREFVRMQLLNLQQAIRSAMQSTQAFS